MDLSTILNLIDTILFVVMGISVLYLFIFTVAGLSSQKWEYENSKKKYKHLVLFPAYKEDKVIISSVTSFLEQEYPKELYKVVVIADQLKESTIIQLKELPIKVLIVNFENSSKAKALNYAMKEIDEESYNLVTILDADNTVNPDFLVKINNAYEAGPSAIQAHRIAKNRNTDIAILDAVSEEINNTIFRKGFSKLGFSATLIGSGMSFEYDWFKENINKVSTAGEDKELEKLLLKQRIHVGYLENVFVYDEKTQKKENFHNQRRRWLAAQYSSLFNSLPDIPAAISSGNIDYLNKITQWMMLPRILLVISIGLISAIALVINWVVSIKWWLLLLFLIFVLCLAIPDYLVDKKLEKAIRKIPILAFMMFINLFRLKGVNKKFIHTEHGEHKNEKL